MSDELPNEIPLPQPGDPLCVVWYLPDDQRAVLWTRDGVTFEAPLRVPPADPENPYRVDWPLTAWSMARRSDRTINPIAAAAVDLNDRHMSLPLPGAPLMACGDDVLVWKAADGNMYTTPRGASPYFWNVPGAERGWVIDFTTFDEVHPYDFDLTDQEPLLEHNTRTPSDENYLAAANTYYANADAVRPARPTFCPECGEDTPPESDYNADHVYANNGVLLIGCEGYHVQNPNTFGIAAPNWQDWQNET